MSYQPPRLRCSYLIRITILLTIFSALFAEGLFPITIENRTSASPLAFAPCVAPCFESFDNVTAPALPPGWNATLETGQPSDIPWTTVNSLASDSAPNAAFAGAPNHATDNRLTSRNIGIDSSTAVLTFRRKNNFETDADGMVLEISIDGDFFQDIIFAGGSFINGGYNGNIKINEGNPIGGRNAWTGNSGGFVTTTVRLPDSADDRTVRFRWRVGTNNTVGSEGVFIDSISLTNFVEPPANDNFANAQPILGSSGLISSSNMGAGKEPNEPNHANLPGAASIWFRWQAPSDGKFTFTTVGSSTDTLLAVYTGANFPGLPVASNDDEEFACQPHAYSGLSFAAVGGITYNIAVDRRTFTRGGNIHLRWGRSATISGRLTTASFEPGVNPNFIQLSIGTLFGEICYRDVSLTKTLSFKDVPINFDYEVTVLDAPAGNFRPYPGNPDISPLTGDVTNLNFFQSTPAHNISGTVKIAGGDTSGIKVMCVAVPEGLFTKPAADLGDGNYLCSSLPRGATYLITPSKLGFKFDPPNRLYPLLHEDIFNDNYEGSAAPARTISGKVTNSSGTGISGISVALSGSQTATKVTDANGNYSFTDVLHGGDYTVTASNPNLTFTPPNVSFTNLSADQTANFSATFVLQLVLDDTGQVAALNSILLIRDPFSVIDIGNVLNSGMDPHTRISIFLTNFQLGPNEPASAVEINLIDSSNQPFNSIPAEAVVPLSEGFTQVTFRLPSGLASGTCVVSVKAHGLTSNTGAIKIK